MEVSIGTTMASIRKIMIIAEMMRLFLLFISATIPFRRFSQILLKGYYTMKPYILASVILFGALIAYENRKHTKQSKQQEKSFWERENMANSVRRKPLDDLDYISVPLDDLPVDALPDLEEAAECRRILETLSSRKIVNFTGISNTDLKLQYGAPNIDLLTEYDQNYTTLVCTLQKWAVLLYENDLVDEARKVLEFAVSTRSDVSKSYYLLADIYRQQGHPEKINDLIETAGSLNSALKSSIVRTLQESGPYSG